MPLHIKRVTTQRNYIERRAFSTDANQFHAVRRNITTQLLPYNRAPRPIRLYFQSFEIIHHKPKCNLSWVWWNMPADIRLPFSTFDLWILEIFKRILVPSQTLYLPYGQHIHYSHILTSKHECYKFQITKWRKVFEKREEMPRTSNNQIRKATINLSKWSTVYL